MKKITFYPLTLFLLLQSCYFGMFLVEVDLPGNYFLWAENSLDQLKITYDYHDSSTYNMVVEETVFAVGYNKDYIIAKSYSKKSKTILYHIIDVHKNSDQKSEGMSFENYKLMREQLKLPYDLNFSMVFHEVAKN